MEIKFNSGKNESIGPATRTYNPASRKNRRYGEGDFPVPVRMESDRDEAVSFLRSEIRFSDFSKILILISVFMVALTALISLFGAAEYAEITSQISIIESDIENYQQQISQVRKTQSSMNDYRSINDACLDRGMQMIWEPDSSNP